MSDEGPPVGKGRVRPLSPSAQGESAPKASSGKEGRGQGGQHARSSPASSAGEGRGEAPASAEAEEVEREM